METTKYSDQNEVKREKKMRHAFEQGKKTNEKVTKVQ